MDYWDQYLCVDWFCNEALTFVLKLACFVLPETEDHLVSIGLERKV
jgi:hypothetical protein